MLSEDAEILIGKAQLKMTGADVHDVNGVIGALRRTVYCIETKGHNDKEIMYYLWRFTIILSKYVEGEGTINELREKYKKNE